MFAQTLITQLLRFERDRARDINKVQGEKNCDVRVLRFKETWRQREEMDILKDLQSLQPFTPRLGDFIRKTSRQSVNSYPKNECRYLRSWGAPLQLNVKILQKILLCAQEWFELWLAFREDPTKESPDSTKKPSAIVAAMSMQRLGEIRNAFNASLLQAWIKRVFRAKREVIMRATQVISRAMKPMLQRWISVTAIRRKHAAFRIQVWYKRRLYVVMMRSRHAARTRAEGQAYRRILTARSRTWQAARDHPELALDWTAAQTIQAVARGFVSRRFAAHVRSAREIIACRLLHPFLARQEARYRTFVQRMEAESRKQRKWRKLRKRYQTFQGRLMEGVMWNLQARTELYALERSKVANIKSCAAQFASFEQALWRNVGKGKLGKGWVRHSNERGEEQYLNLQTGRVQTDHPHRQVVQLRLRTEGDKAHQALQQHLDHVDKLTLCITTNERCFRERLFDHIADLIRDPAIHL